MTRILFISHFFPPTGGAGVQRSSKFVKYLPHFGFSSVVLTGHSDPNSRWSPEDRSLLLDLPADLQIFRAKLTPGDQQRSDFHLLRRNAYLSAGREAIRDHSPELIFVTMSPFQDARIAAELAGEFGLPWVADLRDPWALDEFQIYRTAWHRREEMKKMRSALASASGIIMNTPVAMQRLISAFPAFKDRPVTSITNGFDSEDFPQGETRVRNERFRIVHTGTFHTKLGLNQKLKSTIYKTLGKCHSGVRLLPRSPYYLLRALESIAARDPRILEEIEVVFAGVSSDEDRQLIAESKVVGNITMTGYLGHDESVRHTRTADLLFLPLHSVAAGDQSSIVPGKTYEYIASGNPILAALPEGDAKTFVEDAGNSRVVDPADVLGMERGIRHFYDEWKNGTVVHQRDASQVRKYERRHLTGELAGFLQGVIAGRKSVVGS
jgi:hypothetical protein